MIRLLPAPDATHLAARKREGDARPDAQGDFVNPILGMFRNTAPGSVARTNPVISQESVLKRTLPHVDHWLSRHLATIDRNIANNGLWIGAVASLFLLQGALIWTHLAWLDEWQAVQIALQSPDLSSLLTNLRYEAHPPLWYAWLIAVNQVGLSPATTLKLAVAILAALAQGAILFHSPFKRTDRLLIAYSEFFLFEFFTVSRSISIGTACAILALAFWRHKRLPWLFIALLPLCDFLFGVLSIALIAFRTRDKPIWPIGFAIWLACSLFAAWTVIPPADIVPAGEANGPLLGFAYWLGQFCAMGFPMQWEGLLPVWNRPPLPLLGQIGLFGFLALLYLETRHRRVEAIALWGMIGLTLLFTILVYPLAVRHLMIVPLALILLKWRDLLEDGTTGVSIWFRAWLAVAAICGLLVAAINFVVPFDNAGLAAAEIRRLGLEHKNWVAFPETSAQGIAAINGMRFERPGSACAQDFIRWNFKSPIADWPHLNAFLQHKAETQGRFYFVTELKKIPPVGFMRELAHISPGYDGQDYHLYVVGPDKPDAQPDLPACNGPTRPLDPGYMAK